MVIDMFHVPVDVVATFNVQGKIKPNFIRLEDEEHALQTYKIERVIFSREENYAGVQALFFCCSIVVGNRSQIANIRFHIKTHQWVLVNGTEPVKSYGDVY